MDAKQSVEASVKSNVSSTVSSASRKKSIMPYEPLRENQPPNSYIGTLMNLLKGNIGTGCFAMADAMKNGGMALGSILTLVIGFIALLCQHILIKCATTVKARNNLEFEPDYAETVEMSFSSSKSEKWRKLAPSMKKTCNVFICIAQLGFCCVYFLFIGTNLKNVLDFYDVKYKVQVWIAIGLIPVWLTAMIRTLKFIGEFN